MSAPENDVWRVRHSARWRGAEDTSFLRGLLLYLLSPIDLIPDFVPVIGSADDLIVSAVVLRWVGRRVGLDDLRRRWTGDPAGFEVLRRLLGM